MSLVHSIVESRNFDLNALNNYWVVDVREFSVATIQAVKVSTWATAVLTIYRSHDGIGEFALETPITLTAASTSATIDTSGIAYLVVRLTTLEGSAVLANLSALRKASA